MLMSMSHSQSYLIGLVWGQPSAFIKPPWVVLVLRVLTTMTLKMMAVCPKLWGLWNNKRGRKSEVAQKVKRLPALQETWVRSLGWEDPLEKWMATHSRQPTLVFLPGEFHGQRTLVGYNPWGLKESDTTEWQILSLFRRRKEDIIELGKKSEI